MNVIADLCVVPIGVGVSVSKYVAECERILKDAGLKTKLHAYGTNIEGDWDAVFAAIKECHQIVHEMGAPSDQHNAQVWHTHRPCTDDGRQNKQRRTSTDRRIVTKLCHIKSVKREGPIYYVSRFTFQSSGIVMDLFDQNLQQNRKRSGPLAHRMRPDTLDEFVGQEHLLGSGPAPLSCNFR